MESPVLIAPEKVRAVVTTNWGKDGYRPVVVRSIESYYIESNLDQDSDNFSIVIGDPRATLGDLLRRDNEIRVQVFGIGSDVPYLLTGIVDDVDVSEDGRITLTGRDNSAIATDTLAESGMWRNQKAEKFIEKQARELKLTSRFELAPASTKKKIVTDGTETAWEFWYRLVRKEQQWLWFTSDGILKSGTLNSNAEPTYFFGVPPKDANASEAKQWIPVEKVTYRKTTQTRVGDVIAFYKDGTDHHMYSFKHADPLTAEWLKRPLKYIQDQHISSRQNAIKAVYEEIYESKVGALEIKVTIPDIGVIIRANQIALLHIPEVALGGKWFIVGSRIVADEAGFTQEIRLREAKYPLTRRIPDDPEVTKEPAPPDDLADCTPLCEVIPRWCDAFVHAAHQWRANVPFDLFLSTIVAICHWENRGAFKNCRSNTTGNQGPVPGVKNVEWFDWDGKPRDGINSFQEWKESFCNEKGSMGLTDDVAVGPMQLYTREFKYKADSYRNGEFDAGTRDEYRGNRWLPEANIYEAAYVLSRDKGGNREETLWAAVAAYGPHDDGGVYVAAVKNLVYQKYFPAIQDALKNCIQEDPVDAAGPGITIPVSHFTTHCTANYTSFYAYDFMDNMGTPVYLQESADMDKDYDQPPHLQDWRPGYGGWTFQIKGASGTKYWITHLDETDPDRYKGGHIKAGGYIGRLTKNKQKADWINGAHVHVGSDSWPKPPSGSPDCPF